MYYSNIEDVEDNEIIEEIDLEKLKLKSMDSKTIIQIEMNNKIYDEFTEIYEYNRNYILENIWKNFDNIKKRIIEDANKGYDTCSIYINIADLDWYFNSIFIRPKHYTEYLCDILTITRWIDYFSLCSQIKKRNETNIFYEYVPRINQIKDLKIIIDKFILQYLGSNIEPRLFYFINTCEDNNIIKFKAIQFYNLDYLDNSDILKNAPIDELKEEFKKRQINNDLHLNLLQIDDYFNNQIKKMFEDKKIKGIKKISFSVHNINNINYEFIMNVQW